MIYEGKIENFEEFAHSFNKLSQEIQQLRIKNERVHAERLRKHAEAARRGELGDDWAKVQERIDNGETTLRDVFSGEDTSDAAASLRQTAQRNIRKAMQQARQDAEDNDEEDPFTAIHGKLSVMSRETEQRVQNLQSF
jgi:hypothetical protein